MLPASDAKTTTEYSARMTDAMRAVAVSGPRGSPATVAIAVGVEHLKQVQQLARAKDHDCGERCQPAQPVREGPAGTAGRAHRRGDHPHDPRKPPDPHQPQYPQESKKGHGEEDDLPPVALQERAGRGSDHHAKDELGDEHRPEHPGGDLERGGKRASGIGGRLRQHNQHEDDPEHAYRQVELPGDRLGETLALARRALEHGARSPVV